MGGGNAQKTAMSRAKNAAKAAKSGGGGGGKAGLEKRTNNMDLKCTICMQCFPSTQAKGAQEHAASKHPKEDFKKCFPMYVLTEQECHVWIQSGMNHGMAKNTTFTSELRTNRRTAGFVNLDMARTVRERLPAELLRQVEGCSPGTRVQGVYEEWRVTQYEPGELFRPHYDDSVFRGRADNGAVGETSSHTVLAVLSQDFRGGATRFWPSGRYEEPVDVLAPQGSVLIFEQRTLLHEGCAIESGVKFVAQTGLMRAPCSGAVEQAPQPVLFRWGPGFKAF